MFFFSLPMVLKDLMLLHWWFCWVLAIGGSLKKPLILPPAHCTRQGFPGTTRSSHAFQPFSLIAQCLWFSSSMNNWTRFLYCIIISLPAHKMLEKITTSRSRISKGYSLVTHFCTFVRLNHLHTCRQRNREEKWTDPDLQEVFLFLTLCSGIWPIFNPSM